MKYSHPRVEAYTAPFYIFVRARGTQCGAVYCPCIVADIADDVVCGGIWFTPCGASACGSAAVASCRK